VEHAGDGTERFLVVDRVDVIEDRGVTDRAVALAASTQLGTLKKATASWTSGTGEGVTPLDQLSPAGWLRPAISSVALWMP
jgi:hypothetical protein